MYKIYVNTAFSIHCDSYF